jgi:hypothetical protein
MHRYVPVVGRTVMGDIAIPILLKPMVDKYPHPTSLLLQFVCCFLVALPVAVALNQLHIDCAACGPAGRGGSQFGVPSLGGCGVYGWANPAPERRRGGEWLTRGSPIIHGSA